MVDTPAERQKKYRERMKERGFKKVSVYIMPDKIKALRQYAEKLRKETK